VSVVIVHGPAAALACGHVGQVYTGSLLGVVCFVDSGRCVAMFVCCTCVALVTTGGRHISKWQACG
jgi:hypothetical protein